MMTPLCKRRRNGTERSFGLFGTSERLNRRVQTVHLIQLQHLRTTFIVTRLVGMSLWSRFRAFENELQLEYTCKSFICHAPCDSLIGGRCGWCFKAYLRASEVEICLFCVQIHPKPSLAVTPF